VAAGCAQKAPVQSFADLPERIRPGHAVYVTDEQGEQTRGRLHEVSRSALTMSVADGVLRFPADRIRSIDRYGDPLWNGLAIGLGFGTAMALFADQREVPCADGRPGVCRDAELGSRLGAIAVFGAVGTGIDALIRGRTPAYRAPDQRSSSSLVISPSASPRGAAVILTVSF
jgi:hypothetical protein